MRLSAGFLWFLTVCAAVLITAVLLSSTAPVDSCKAADQARDRGLMTQAEGAYTAVLADGPDSACASAGMRSVVLTLCQRADRLRLAGIGDEARKRYLAVLAIDAPKTADRPAWDVQCALDGLAKVAH